MGFSLKPKNQNNGGGGQDIDFEAIAEQVEEGPNIAVITGIIDLGTQEGGDGYRTDVKGKPVSTIVDDEDDAQDLIDRIKELSGKDIEYEEVDEGFKIPGEVYEKKPAQEVAIFADIPDCLVDYGDGEPKPYRVMLNRSFKGVLSGFRLTAAPPTKKDGAWTFAANSMLTKLAKATRTTEVLEDGEDNMNVGLFLGKGLLVNLEKKGNFINVSGVMPLMRGQKPADLPYEPVGISFDNASVDLFDSFKVRGAVLKKIKEALNYGDDEGANMREAVKEYEALLKSRAEQNNDDGDEEEEQEERKPAKKAAAKTAKAKATTAKKAKAKTPPPEDQEDDAPFDGDEGDDQPDDDIPW